MKMKRRTFLREMLKSYRSQTKSIIKKGIGNRSADWQEGYLAGIEDSIGAYDYIYRRDKDKPEKDKA